MDQDQTSWVPDLDQYKDYASYQISAGPRTFKFPVHKLLEQQKHKYVPIQGFPAGSPAYPL